MKKEKSEKERFWEEKEDRDCKEKGKMMEMIKCCGKKKENRGYKDKGNAMEEKDKSRKEKY